MNTQTQVAVDFDRIATLTEPKWNNNIHYHPLIHRCVQNAEIQHLLEVGSGKGRLAAQLAMSAGTVEGIDLSPAMIEAASSRYQHFDNLHFTFGDYMQADYTDNPLDAIVSVATVHHLDLRHFLQKASGELNPGGHLIVLDLYRQLWSDMLLSFFALPISIGLRIWCNRRFRMPSRDRRIWRMHEQHDQLHTWHQVRYIAKDVLPACKVRRMLFWRYFLYWKKPK